MLSLCQKTDRANPVNYYDHIGATGFCKLCIAIAKYIISSICIPHTVRHDAFADSERHVSAEFRAI